MNAFRIVIGREKPVDPLKRRQDSTQLFCPHSVCVALQVPPV